MKRIFLIATAAAFLAACNNSSAPSTTTPAADSTPADHTGHDHTAPVNADLTFPVQEVKDGQEVFFANLKDGEAVKNPVIIKFGVKGMAVEPAGPVNTDKGHHHIIIDGAFVPAGKAIPAENETCKHYGKGQTADTLELAPGKHTLTMQFANGMHISYGEKMSKTITVDVK